MDYPSNAISLLPLAFLFSCRLFFTSPVVCEVTLIDPMEGDAGEFEEWELLLDTSDGAISDEDSRVLEAIEEEGGSQGMVRTDYFSLGSVGSDNRGWTDPMHPRKELSDFWPEDRKVITFDAKDSVGFPDTAETEVEVEVEIDVEHELTVVEKEKTRGPF